MTRDTSSTVRTTGSRLGLRAQDDAFNPIERLLQHMLVEKENGRQSLILGRCRDMFLDRQMG